MKEIMDTYEANLAAREKAAEAARKGCTKAKIESIEKKFKTCLNIEWHIDGFSFDGANEWGEPQRVNVYE